MHIHVPVCPSSSVIRQIVDRNALVMASVPRTWRVLIKNVAIHVRALAVLMLIVE